MILSLTFDASSPGLRHATPNKIRDGTFLRQIESKIPRSTPTCFTWFRNSSKRTSQKDVLRFLPLMKILGCTINVESINNLKKTATDAR